MGNKIFALLMMLSLCAILPEKSLSQVNNSGVKPIEVKCEQAALVRQGHSITATMDIDMSELKVKSNQAAIFTPVIVNGADTLKLSSVGVYGRTRWYQYERSGLRPLGGKGEQSIRYSKRPSVYSYESTVAYERWMNGSELILLRRDYGCCGCIDEDGPLQETLAEYRANIYEPEFRFLPALAEEVKTRELTGRAYVDFPVNLTVIYPDYRNNSVELAKIIATIDSVRNDKDITVASLSIKGWASPESPWENNTRLAKGRTEALKQYVQRLYSFDYGFIKTDYEPEDWEGLRKYVETSTLPHRYEILALIDDTTIAPDPKELKLKTMYPDEYKFLLETVYPGLRHSDYTIEYIIKGFSDLNEIAEVMHTNPSKLSLNEMYLLAGTKEPGTEEYNEIMETAARIYPTDETALVNAATVAMQRGDMKLAERYLSKAADSGEVFYARGVLAGIQGDYDEAFEQMQHAADFGCMEARKEMEILKQLQNLSK